MLVDGVKRSSSEGEDVVEPSASTSLARTRTRPGHEQPDVGLLEDVAENRIRGGEEEVAKKRGDRGKYHPTWSIAHVGDGEQDATMAEWPDIDLFPDGFDFG